MKAILFDFDGTIADTAPGIVATMAATFTRMNKTIPDELAMRNTIGIPLRKALQILNNLSDAEADEATSIYNELFRTIEVGKTRIFPNVTDTLESLKKQGTRLAIVTSRNRESLDLILKRFGIYDYFEQIITNDDGLAHKPAPDMVLELLNRMKLTAKDVTVVGDTTYDIEMGNRAHCNTIAVTYGNHTREQLLSAHPSKIIDDFSLILP